MVFCKTADEYQGKVMTFY